MTIWEDISLHIHKIVSCVLTIPFVELCPNRHQPPLQSSAVHSAEHLRTHSCKRLLFFIYHSQKNTFDKNDTLEMR